MDQDNLNVSAGDIDLTEFTNNNQQNNITITELGSSMEVDSLEPSPLPTRKAAKRAAEVPLEEQEEE